MNLNNIRVILFDVGGTLIDVQPSVGDVYAEVAAHYKIKADPDLLNSRFQWAWRKLSSPDHLINKAWWRRVVADVFRIYQGSLSKAMFDEIYERFKHRRTWRVYEDVKPTLNKLSRLGLKIAVASNWDARLPSLLKELGLASYFNYQFISFRMKIQKPNPEFFRICAHKIGCRPKDMLHIGDDKRNDEWCPRKVGLHTLLIDRSGPPLVSRNRISSIKDILARF